MNLIWGIILTLLSGLAYFGQVVAAFWPHTASRLGLTESKSDVDPAFYADVRGEAFWDLFTLWTLPLAGVLMVLNNPLWAYMGIVGGSMYLYFAGRGIVTRAIMQRRGIRIGASENVKIAYTFLALWGLAAISTIIMAIAVFATA
jgi:hypothetical protein